MSKPKNLTDQQEYYESIINQLTSEIDTVNNINNQLITELESKMHSLSYNSEKKFSLLKQLDNYDLNLNNIKESNKIKNLDEKGEDTNELETEQHILLPQNKSSIDEEVYLNAMKESLININYEILNQKSKNEMKLVSENIGNPSNSVMIITNTKSFLNFTIQFYRIDVNSTLSDIRKIGTLFFNISPEVANEYNFYLLMDSLDNINIKRTEETLTINSLIKNKGNIKRAAFLFLKKEDENQVSNDLLKQIFLSDSKDVEVKREVEKQVSDTVQSFYNSFVGLSNYMINKTKKMIMKQLVEKKEIPSNNWKYVLCVNGISFLIYFMFLIITILSIIKINTPYSDYNLNASLTKILTSNNFLDYNYDSIVNDLYGKLSFLFYCYNMPEIYSGNAVISNIRLSLFRTKNFSCPNNITGNQNCYYPYFNADTFDNNSTFNSSINISTDNYILNSLNNSNLDCWNYSTSALPVDTTIFNNFMLNLTDDMTMKKKDQSMISDTYFSITGQLGTYIPKMGYTIFLTDDIDGITLKNILYIISKSNIWNSGLRGIITTFTFFNNISKKCIYVQILYEINSSGYIITNSTITKIFEPNIYLGANGVIMYLYDVIRMICVILFILLVLEIFLSVKPGLDGKINPKDYITLLFQPKIFLNLTISILFIYSFSTKLSKLNFDITQLFTIKSRVIDFYTYANAFRNILIIENFLIFAIITRLLFFFNMIKRIRTFFEFINNSFKRIYFLFLIIGFLYFAFVIFANNLHGIYFVDFRDVSSSIRKVLMISVGFSPGTFKSMSPIANNVFLFLLFSLIIYFLLNILIGAFVEMSRITALMKGHVFDYKEIPLSNDQKKKVNKEDEKALVLNIS